MSQSNNNNNNNNNNNKGPIVHRRETGTGQQVAQFHERLMMIVHGRCVPVDWTAIKYIVFNVGSHIP